VEEYDKRSESVSMIGVDVDPLGIVGGNMKIGSLGASLAS
jgi:hypothetical protein